MATGQNAQFGSDFAVVGLTHFLLLFALIISIGVASGGHFNPAVTTAFIALRRIDPIDGLVDILLELSGGVPATPMKRPSWSMRVVPPTTGPRPSARCSADVFQGFLIEGIGTFVLVSTVLAGSRQP